jgi:hypothetical protein
MILIGGGTAGTVILFESIGVVVDKHVDEDVVVDTDAKSAEESEDDISMI